MEINNNNKPKNLAERAIFSRRESKFLSELNIMQREAVETVDDDGKYTKNILIGCKSILFCVRNYAYMTFYQYPSICQLKICE